MNLPNKLTLLRIALIPVFIAARLLAGAHSSPAWALAALLVFALASLTDLLDGRIARSRGLVTDFGKLMDPLADKLLVISALILLLPLDRPFEQVCLVLILAREFIVTSIRLLAAGKGLVLAADQWGKAKTVAQMSFLCVALLRDWGRLVRFPDILCAGLDRVVPLLFYTMLLLTVASGAHYVVKNRALFADR